MEDIRNLYNRFYEDPAKLTDDDRLLLVGDFLKRQTRRIPQGNSGNYQIIRECNNYIFNGCLIIDTTNNSMIGLQLFIDSPQIVRVSDNEEIVLVNCVYEKVDDINERNMIKQKEESNNVEDMITSLERLSDLHNSGSLTDEEFEFLKNKLLG